MKGCDQCEIFAVLMRKIRESYEKNHEKLSSLAVACAMVVSLAGCGVSVTGVSFDIPDTLEKGSSIMATPEYAYDGETPEAAKADDLVDKLGMSYTSSDPNVLTVDENGNITAVGIGTAEVAMSNKDGKIATSKVVEVVVTPVSLDMVDSITLTKENNSKAKLEAVVQPEDATHVEIEFTSSNEDVATVNSDGEINAVDVGETTITASIKETDLTAECIVTVAPDIESIELSDTSLKMKKDGTAQLTATANPDGASIDGIAFASDAPAASSSFEYGALPFSLATDGNWWYIDSSDSAFQAVVANINAMRAAGELPALSVSGSLCSIAQDRAWYQIENNTLTHDGASTPEILAQGQQSASEVCSVWQNSPSHYAVIMNPAHTQMGVGCWFEYNGKCVWCVTFS